MTKTQKYQTLQCISRPAKFLLRSTQTRYDKLLTLVRELYHMSETDRLKAIKMMLTTYTDLPLKETRTNLFTLIITLDKLIQIKQTEA